jgi:8-hydroxy-5-deazaflavin:NADPH oxidoreductase
VNIGVLGTGVVGRGIATRLVELGHSVALGTRDPEKPEAQEWLRHCRRGGRVATFTDAAGYGAMVINATSGAASIAALMLAGERNLHGKVLLDVSNPLDFSQGMPPTLTVANTDSLAEQIQREFPHTHVVKSLNTVNVDVMVRPESVPGEHTMFVAGNDGEAKATVGDLLRSLGWRDVLDLGGIEAARGLEMYVLHWVNVRMALGTNAFNIKVITA